MISLFKRVNRHVLYFAVGIAVTFSVLKELLMVSAATAYTMGMAFSTFVAVVTVLSVLMFALFTRLLVYLSFRICVTIFARKSGLLYPFPIFFRDYESTTLSFSLLCFLIAGAVSLPALFLPTLSDVLGALRSVVTWFFLAIGAAYFVKHNGHDYDKKSLAFSLSIVPLVLVAITLALTVVEVVR